MPALLINPAIKEFPFWLLFMRDQSIIEQSLVKQERLGGTLRHLEQEMKE
jgi:hypothetical protein